MKQPGVSLTWSLQVSFADSEIDRKLWSVDCHSILQLLDLPSNKGTVNMYTLLNLTTQLSSCIIHTPRPR